MRIQAKLMTKGYRSLATVVLRCHCGKGKEGNVESQLCSIAAVVADCPSLDEVVICWAEQSLNALQLGISLM
jgi:hypothetical protein